MIAFCLMDALSFTMRLWEFCYITC